MALAWQAVWASANLRGVAKNASECPPYVAPVHWLPQIAPSSTTPLQSVSRPSHVSTPPFVMTHAPSPPELDAPLELVVPPELPPVPIASDAMPASTPAASLVKPRPELPTGPPDEPSADPAPGGALVNSS